MTMYAQVEIRKGHATDVAWIEERGAKVGATVELKLASGARDKGWVVERVFGRLPERQVVDGRDAYRTHRTRTDI